MQIGSEKLGEYIAFTEYRPDVKMYYYRVLDCQSKVSSSWFGGYFTHNDAMASARGYVDGLGVKEAILQKYKKDREERSVYKWSREDD